MWRFVLAIFCAASLMGCGGQIDEVPPATETPQGPSEEEMQRIMKESMEKGGAGGRYKPPGQ